MSTLDFLTEDFSLVALDDLGVNITIKHKTGQTLNVVNGGYTDNVITESQSCVVDSIKKSDLDKFPSRFSVEDKKVYVSEDSFSFVPAKGDFLVIGTVEYVIVTINELDSLLLLYCKKK